MNLWTKGNYGSKELNRSKSKFYAKMLILLFLEKHVQFVDLNKDFITQLKIVLPYIYVMIKEWEEPLSWEH